MGTGTEKRGKMKQKTIQVNLRGVAVVMQPKCEVEIQGLEFGALQAGWRVREWLLVAGRRGQSRIFCKSIFETQMQFDSQNAN